MITLRIPKVLRYTMYATFLFSLITGVLFFSLKTWFTVQGEFGPEIHPWQFPVLKLHAVSAFIFILIFGALLGSHVLFGLRAKLSFKSGITLLGVAFSQIVTAYLLYYASNESLRYYTEWVHLLVGSSLPVLLILHIVTGRKRHKRSHAATK